MVNLRATYMPLTSTCRMPLLLVLVTLPALAVETNRPEHPPHLPKEAYSACSNLSEQDPCSITTPTNQLIEGICLPVQDNNQPIALACRPNHMPPPPEGMAPPPDEMPPAEESSEQ